MTEKKVSWKYLPSKLPVGLAALWWLVLDRFHAPGWAFGVLWTLVGVFTVFTVVEWFTTDYVKPLDIR